MARSDIRVTQSVVEQVSFLRPSAVVTQSVIEFIIGLGITCGNPPDGSVGTFYSHAFPTGSGDPPYSYLISAGALPLGLTLNAGTGVASGIPVASGLYSFTVQVTDSFGATNSVACSITINRVNSRGVRIVLSGMKVWPCAGAAGSGEPRRVYRPQFMFPSPAETRLQDCDQWYDSHNVPALAPNAGDPTPILDIPLVLDPDGDFHWRGVKFDHGNAANIGVRFRDPWGNYLSSDFVPIWLAFLSPSASSFTLGQSCVTGIGEPEILCPKRSIVTVDICSYDAVPWSTIQ